ncbi:MAG: RNA polymerase sigma factor [Candidatus Aminicenantales bacterium]
MNDKQLVASCLQGDVEEFRRIVDKYRGKIMALALNMLGNREDAEDACQDAFVHAYQHLDQFDDRRSFRTWLYTIVYNLCLDQLRKRHRFSKFFHRMKRESLSSAREQALKSSAGETLPMWMLKDLSPKERAAVFLWTVEGYTSEEIGSLLRCSPATARVHLYKARKKIKALLERKNASM